MSPAPTRPTPTLLAPAGAVEPQSPAVSPLALDAPGPAGMPARRPAPVGCLTVAEAAAALGLSRDTFDRRLADGTLTRLGLIETNRFGRRRFFAAASIDTVLYRRRVGGLRRIA